MTIPWTRRNAAHLLRRAAWGGTPDEIEQALGTGLDATVDRLLDDAAIDDSALEARLAQIEITDPPTLVGWWLTRLVLSRRGLRERMTFFLHDHFATSIRKVRNEMLMLQQNGLLRRYAFGNFTDLTIEISKDPAMLIWLDNFRSRKEHPNENYGRELLELFTLGLGNYAEEDVMSAARAFTGWSLRREPIAFRFVAAWHDYGQKTFLGRTGNWDGDDIVRIACGTVAHARFLTAKLFEYFVGHPPEEATLDRLAAIYANARTELAPLIRAILTSEEMYAESALWQRVKTPLEHAVISMRLLGSAAEPRLLLVALRDQGLLPFAPPDVDGWPSGMPWINSATLLSRINFGGLLAGRYDAARFSAAATADELIDLYLERLGPLEIGHATRATLRAWLAPSGTLLRERERGLAQAIVALPEFQRN